jgi:hypothetical protein
MASKHFKLTARVSSSNPRAVKPVLQKLITKGSVKETRGEFHVEADMVGGSARELNRALLSELRRAEKKTRVRAEWTSNSGTTQRFFDYVLKKTSRK